MLSHFPPPTQSTKHFVDCCGGGGCVALNAPGYDRITYNDVYGEVTNFFSVLRDPATSDKLLVQLELTPFSRGELATAQDRGHSDKIERARRFWVRCHQSFGGFETNSTWKVSRRQEDSPSVSNARAVARLPFVSTLVQRWNIENRDVFKVIDFYDAPTTLFYLDPPYDTIAISRCSRASAG